MKARTLGGAALLSLVAMALSAGCSSNASPSEALASTTAGIQGGAADTGDPYAVGLCIGNGPGQCQLLCSGALIAPNLVMSARHCVAQSPQQIDCAVAKFGAQNAATGNFWITTYNKMFQGTTGWHQAKQIIQTPGTAVCGNDMSLIILKDNVSAGEATPITPVVQYKMTDHTRYSTTVTAIGFGITAVGATDSGTRRIRQNINLTCIPGDKLIDCGNLAGAQLTAAEFVSGDSTCEGDSGSSAYEQKNFTKGIPVSFGVLSRGGASGSTCVSPIYTRTDAWKDWIVANALDAATQGGYPAPSWTQPPPVVPDAGTPGSDSGSVVPPSTGNLGDACADPTECNSGKCASPASGQPSVCTQACDVTAQDCPAGFQCTDTGAGGQCFVKPATPTSTTTTTTSGCSLASSADPAKPVPWKQGGIAALVVLAALVRRRRRS